MRLMKILKKMMFVFLLVVIFDISSVYAATNNATLCIGGYSYYMETENNSFKFIDLIGKSLSDFGISTGTFNGTTVYNGTSIKYSLNGYYYGGSSKLNNRCYTYVRIHNPNVSNDGNGNTITTQNYDYTLKQCGSKYDIKLNFEENSKFLSSIVLDNATANIKNSYQDLYGSNIIESNGKISLIIRPDENSKLLSVWDRIGLSIQYDGTEDYGRTGKGSCTVYGGNSNNIKDKYIKCTNITPYQAIRDRNSGKNLNDRIYKIYIYLNGIKTSDFDENVSDSVKQEYVNSCGGNNGSIYLGYITQPIIHEEVIALTNPINTNTNQGIRVKNLCNQVDGITKANEKLKKAYVSECYKSKLTYTEYQNQISTIETKLANLKKMFEGVNTYTGLAGVAKNEKLLCTDTRLGIPVIDSLSVPFDSKIVYENYDGYWGMICVEDYYVSGGSPSLVKAGTGVFYDNQVQINKTCSIFQLKTVQKQEQCEYYSDCDAYFDHGNDGIINSADTNGGPNNGFDSCIETCDGGKYTQNCINKCYSSNYSDERASLLTKSSLSSFNFSNHYNIIAMAGEYNTYDTSTSVDPSFRGTIELEGGFKMEISSGTYQEDTNGDGKLDFNCTDPAVCINVKITDANGNVVSEGGSSVGCNANIYALCTSYSGPPGCSDDAEKEYQEEIAKSKSELASLRKLAESDSHLEEYTIVLTDSKTGVKYKINGNSKNTIVDKPQLNINKNSELSKNNLNFTTYTIGSEGDSVLGVNSSVVSTIYDVELPIAHVKKDDANVLVVENSKITSTANKYFKYDSNANNDVDFYAFSLYDSYKQSLFSQGQKVYYTNLDSPLYNVLVNSGKTSEELADIDHVNLTINGKTDIYELINNSENIAVTFKIGNFGENNFVSFDSSGLYCYYGVYNFLHSGSDKDVVYPDGGESEGQVKPSPTGGGTSNLGLRYYYREIYLNPDQNGYGGIFPNDRTPRWNWTGTITNGVASGAANNDDPSYIVDPEKLIEDIETKGDSVFTDQSEYDYVFVMTPEIINQIREYNKSKIDGRKITYLDFALVGASNDKRNYSQVIANWYSNLSPSVLVEISGCNNAKNGKC